MQGQIDLTFWNVNAGDPDLYRVTYFKGAVAALALPFVFRFYEDVIVIRDAGNFYQTLNENFLQFHEETKCCDAGDEP